MHLKNWIQQWRFIQSNFSWHSTRSVNSLKTAVACLIAYLLVTFTPLPQSQWIVITVLVVMSAQSTLGGVLIKSKMRFWGTVAGAMFSVLMLWCFGVDRVVVGLALFVSILFFAYVAGSAGDVSAAGTLGAVTVAMMLLAPNPNVTVAGVRFLEIVIGIVLAYMVSRFMWPVRAHNVLRRGFADLLLDLRQNFNLCWDSAVAEAVNKHLELDEKITKAFPVLRKLIHESKPELRKEAKLHQSFQQILTSMIKIYRSINMVYYSEHSSVMLGDLKGLEQFKLEISDYMLQLAEQIAGKPVQSKNFLIADSVSYIEGEFKAVMQGKEYAHIVAVTSFLFAAKVLAEELRRLGDDVERV